MKISQIINNIRNRGIVQFIVKLKIVLFGGKKNCTETKIKNIHLVTLNTKVHSLKGNYMIIGGYNYQVLYNNARYEGELLSYKMK